MATIKLCTQCDNIFTANVQSTSKMRNRDNSRQMNNRKIQIRHMNKK